MSLPTYEEASQTVKYFTHIVNMSLDILNINCMTDANTFTRIVKYIRMIIEGDRMFSQIAKSLYVLNDYNCIFMDDTDISLNTIRRQFKANMNNVRNYANVGDIKPGMLEYLITWFNLVYSNEVIPFV